MQTPSSAPCRLRSRWFSSGPKGGEDNRDCEALTGKGFSMWLNCSQPLPSSIISVSWHVPSCGVSFIRHDDWLMDKTEGWHPHRPSQWEGDTARRAVQSRSHLLKAPLPSSAAQLTQRCFSSCNVDYHTFLLQVSHILLQISTKVLLLHPYPIISSGSMLLLKNFFFSLAVLPKYHVGY